MASVGRSNTAPVGHEMTPLFRRAPAEAAIDRAHRAVDQSGQLPERRCSCPTARHRGGSPRPLRALHVEFLCRGGGGRRRASRFPAGGYDASSPATEAADPDAHPAIGTDTGAASDVDRILIRPDGYVCWVGAGPEASLAAAVDRWFGGQTGTRQLTNYQRRRPAQPAVTTATAGTSPPNARSAHHAGPLTDLEFGNRVFAARWACLVSVAW